MKGKAGFPLLLSSHCAKPVVDVCTNGAIAGNLKRCSAAARRSQEIYSSVRYPFNRIQSAMYNRRAVLWSMRQ